MEPLTQAEERAQLVPLFMRVVAADSDPVMLRFYEAALSNLGHQVVAVARDGRELLDVCAWASPELIVTELHLPTLDGVDASIRITERRSVPVILVSAEYSQADVERARKNHVMSYLVKPIKEVDLEAAIAVTLTRFGKITADQVPPPPMRG